MSGEKFVFRSAIILMVLLSVSICIGHDIHDRQVLKKPEREAAVYSIWDNNILQAAGPEGALYIQFEGFTEGSRGFVANIYFRSVYLLYPRSVFVRTDTKILNNAPQILDDNIPPTDAWLASHGVKTVLTVGRDMTQKGVPVIVGLRRISSTSDESTFHHPTTNSSAQ